ncbi:NERD domain-containing protein [Vibrio parahaemolyticus]|nr:NERD domain-containing protein [Vibrio parahaemolyticus]
MEFFPKQYSIKNRGERTLWQWCQKYLVDIEGIALLKPALYDKNMRWREPDVLIASPLFGILLIESKGCSIDDIDSVSLSSWEMSEKWYRRDINPLEQLREQSLSLRGYLSKKLNCGVLASRQIPVKHCIALPFIDNDSLLVDKGFSEIVRSQPVILKDHLNKERDAVFNAIGLQLKPVMSQRQWGDLAALLRSPCFAEKTSQVPLEVVAAKQKLPGRLIKVPYSGSFPTLAALNQHLPSDVTIDKHALHLVATRPLEQLRQTDASSVLTKESQQYDVEQDKAHTSAKVNEGQYILHFDSYLRFAQGTGHFCSRSEEYLLVTRTIEHIFSNDPLRKEQLLHDAHTIRDALVQLDSYGIDLNDYASIPSEFDYAWHDLRLREDLQQIQTEFKERLHDEGKKTFEERTRRWLEHSYQPAGVVVMEGFSFLTPLQLAFIKRCLQQNSTVVVLHPFDENQEWAFEVFNHTYSGVEEMVNVVLPLKFSTQKLQSNSENSALAYLRSNLFDLEKAPLDMETMDKDVSCLRFKHIHQEVQETLSKVKEYLEEGYQPEQIAIVARDTQTYGSIIQEQAVLRKDLGLDNHFVLPHRKLLLTPVGRFILGLYQIWDKDQNQLRFTADQFQDLLLSGWLGKDALESADDFVHVRGQFFERCEERSVWEERLDLLGKVENGPELISRVPARHIDSQNRSKCWLNLIEQVSIICNKLFIEQHVPISSHIENLLAELNNLDGELFDEELKILERVRAVFDELNDAGSIGISTSEFGDIINGLVKEQEQFEEEKQQKPKKIRIWAPESVDGNLSSSKEKQLRVIFYLGCDSSRQPRPASADWPYQRAIFDVNYPGTTARQKLFERYLFLGVVRAARDNLHLSYSEHDGSQSLGPSIYFERVREALGLDPKKLGEHYDVESGLPQSPSQPYFSRVKIKLANPISEYQLSSLAHISLCPQRFLLERLSTRAGCYRDPWQLRSLAVGFWLQLVMDELRNNKNPQSGNNEAIIDDIVEKQWNKVTRLLPILTPIDKEMCSKYLFGKDGSWRERLKSSNLQSSVTHHWENKNASENKYFINYVNLRGVNVVYPYRQVFWVQGAEYRNWDVALRNAWLRPPSGKQRSSEAFSFWQDLIKNVRRKTGDVLVDKIHSVIDEFSSGDLTRITSGKHCSYCPSRDLCLEGTAHAGEE